LRRLQQLQPLGYDRVTWIELARPGIGVDGIGNLIVAALVEAAQIEPHFGDIGVDADGTRISVQGIAELVDLEVENADRAPEGWVATVSVNGLLIRLIGFTIFLAGHISAAQKVPTLRIGRIWSAN
jgi:hypothetical protein